MKKITFLAACIAAVAVMFTGCLNIEFTQTKEILSAKRDSMDYKLIISEVGSVNEDGNNTCKLTLQLSENISSEYECEINNGGNPLTTSNFDLRWKENSVIVITFDADHNPVDKIQMNYDGWISVTNAESELDFNEEEINTEF